MKINAETVKSYLEAINPEKFLTYEVYLVRCVEDGLKPIKRDQWNTIISILGANRRMQDTANVKQWLENIKDGV
jgi:hypothetical protein